MVKRAFTLAEVLITLTIIGVIAAITIPNLMKKYEDAHTVTTVKEAYSIINNAYKLAIRDYGDNLNDWLPNKNALNDNRDNSVAVAKIMSNYLKVTNSCLNFNGSSGCKAMTWGYSERGGNYSKMTGYYLNRTFSDNKKNGLLLTQAGVTLNNNMFVFFRTQEAYGGQGRVTFYVDINGAKGPGKYGYDIFAFSVDRQTGHLSTGYIGSWKYRPMASLCAFNQQPEKENWEKSNGLACSDWIIRKGNVDYKYRNVSAEW